MQRTNIILDQLSVRWKGNSFLLF